MRINLKLIVITSIFALLSAGAAAHADLKIVEHTTFDFSKMTVMGSPVTQDELDMIKRLPIVGGLTGVDVTIYEAGNNVRSDAPLADSIIDLNAKTETVLIPAIKEYMVTSISTNQVDQLAAGATVTLNDQKQTKTILGHQAHAYTFNITNSVVTISGSMWLASDLPDLASSAFGATNPVMRIIIAKTKGFPLQMDAQIDMPMTIDQLAVSYTVSSLATDPLPASTFAIPSDYTKSDALDPAAFGLSLPPLPLSGQPPAAAPAPAPAAPTTSKT